MAEDMSHPEVAKIGLGDISDERMTKAIEILVEAKDLPRTPAVSEVVRSQLSCRRRPSGRTLIKAGM